MKMKNTDTSCKVLLLHHDEYFMQTHHSTIYQVLALESQNRDAARAAVDDDVWRNVL
jgi:hypothetical protein